MIRTGLIWSGAALAVMAGILWWAHGALPEGEIPVHWNADGVADSYAPRGEAFLYLLIVPATALLTSLLLAVAPVLDPFRDNLKRSSKAYLAIWGASMALMAALTGGIAFMMTRGGDADSNEFVRFVMAGCGVLFIVIGNYLPKTRKTFFLGIRTPWTLTSDYAWEKTHRLAGPLYIAAGLLGILYAFTLDGIWLVFAFVGTVLSVTLFSAAYSWFAWRKAGDRTESADYVV